ncbi:MAG TPA: hypothetical protein VGG33_08545 [Polyangia bacterium]
MNQTGFAFANLGWLVPVAGVWAVTAAASVAGHLRASRNQRSAVGLGLRLAGITIVALALLEPSWARAVPRPGANSFAVLVDDSRSVRLGSQDPNQSNLRAMLSSERVWAKRLAETFQLRHYRFDARLERVPDLRALQWDGRASHLGAALRGLAERHRGVPLGGVLLFSDGNATDQRDGQAFERVRADLAGLPPIYPVVIGAGDDEVVDVAVAQLSASETLFEDAPVRVDARLESRGLRGRPVTVELRDERDRVIERKSYTPGGNDDTRTVTFRVPPPPAIPRSPPAPGTLAGAPVASQAPAAPPVAPVHYRVSATLPSDVVEATQLNNVRRVHVPRPRGPTRLLYVGGRPNWEYKFLRRALERDRLLELTGLVRAAAREPKFAFLTRQGEAVNPLYRGFGTTTNDAERFDEPVLVRLDVRNNDELRGGFPKTAEELFSYQGLIIDDMESGFFSAAQQTLVDRFVSERGGGLLMLGGIASFRHGGYERTPIGDLLPVHLGAPRTGESMTAPLGRRLTLTREGWLEAWMRLRDSETAERARLEAMPPFQVASGTTGLKPGATVLARLSFGKSEIPALVMQRAGEGRTAALTVGDLWRWGLRQTPGEADDLAKFWRQTLRALVADVPAPVSADLSPHPAEAGAFAVRVAARGRDFRPAADATVEIDAIYPDGRRVRLSSEPGTDPGTFDAVVRPEGPGVYRVAVRATASDGQLLGEAEAGRAIDLDADEHRAVRPDRAFLAEIARASGGAVVAANELDQWAERLRDRPAPVSDIHVRPLWHSWLVLLIALGCLAAEWTLRRRRGLA